MCKKLMFVWVIGLVLGAAGSASAATVTLLQGDVGTTWSPCVGDPDQNLKPGWILITTPDCAYKECEYRPSCDLCWKDDHPGGVTIEDVNGTCIDIHIDVGNHTTLSGRDRSCEPCDSGKCGPLAIDYFMADDAGTPEDGKVILTLKNLSEGTYVLKSYHNNPAAADWTNPAECEIGNISLLAAVEISGAVSMTWPVYDVPMTGACRDADIGTSLVRFTATGEGDVIVEYIGSTAEGYSIGVNLNGFELFGDPLCCGRLRGDVNGDCKVNLLDVAILASDWLECDLVPESACGQ